MSKPKIPPNKIIAKVSWHIRNTGFPIVSTHPLCWPILLIPPGNGLPSSLDAQPYILKYAPPTTWMNPPIVGFPFLPHSMQRSELYQIFSVRSATNTLQLYTKSLGNCLLTRFTNLIVDTPRFALWQCFIIWYRSANFK